MKRLVLLLCCSAACASAQEASSGFELRTTLSAEGIFSHRLSDAPRLGTPWTSGVRAMFYPTWKISQNWTISGAVQVHTRPYFFEELSTQGYGVKADILQMHLSYSRFWTNRSIVVRVGELSSSFGSFLLRYDDAVNPLIDMPVTYGYYYKPITTYGLTGAQVDATLGRFDARAQLANSSPMNRRSVFDGDQYANWSGGLGYTIVQGFRVGGSAYRGPYLYRQFPYYFRGEANPRDLPATAYGLDLQWGRGPWNAYGELQRFVYPYHVMPTFTQHAGYGEVRRVLNPRWYVAARVSYLRRSVGAGSNIYETAVGFRPNRYQLIKLGYQRLDTAQTRGILADALAIQFVTSFRAISIAKD
jgi:hypothetical protein